MNNKNSWGKSVPKSTRYVTKWSFNILEQWQNARPNKEAVNEEVDTNIVNMTAESLNFLATKFVEGVLSLLFAGQFCIFATFCNG